MPTSQKIILITLIVAAIVFAAALFLSGRKHLNNNLLAIKINVNNIFVEEALTEVDKVRGLSNRPSLPENQGMLFIYDAPDFYSFWMKDMLFALDFIWIKDGRVVEITEKVKPKDYQPPNVLTPKEKVDMVLEVNAGVVKKLNVKIGDSVNK